MIKVTRPARAPKSKGAPVMSSACCENQLDAGAAAAEDAAIVARVAVARVRGRSFVTRAIKKRIHKGGLGGER